MDLRPRRAGAVGYASAIWCLCIATQDWRREEVIRDCAFGLNTPFLCVFLRASPWEAALILSAYLQRIDCGMFQVGRMYLSHPGNLDELAMIYQWRNRQPSD